MEVDTWISPVNRLWCAKTERRNRNYPLTRNYYKNNSLRIIFVIIFEGFCALKMSRKENISLQAGAQHAFSGCVAIKN